MLKKYIELKKEYPNALLLFDDGEVFIVFEEDAEKVHDLLHLPMAKVGGKKRAFILKEDIDTRLHTLIQKGCFEVRFVNSKKRCELTALVDAIEREGWGVYLSYNEDYDTIDFEVSRYTNAGQDFSFRQEMEYENLKSFINGLSEYINYFDPDEEARMWIGEDGHGQRGAPYHIADIVKDMEQAKEMMQELWKILLEVFICHK